jgi:hypothetical protein
MTYRDAWYVLTCRVRQQFLHARGGNHSAWLMSWPSQGLMATFIIIEAIVLQLRKSGAIKLAAAVRHHIFKFK